MKKLLNTLNPYLILLLFLAGLFFCVSEFSGMLMIQEELSSIASESVAYKVGFAIGHSVKFIFGLALIGIAASRILRLRKAL